MTYAVFERRVPLAILFALCVHAAGVVWWASAREADLRFQQRRVEALEQDIVTARTAQTEILERLARIEERLAAQNDLLRNFHQETGRGR